VRIFNALGEHSGRSSTDRKLGIWEPEIVKKTAPEMALIRPHQRALDPT
jgi:hypothetical protein